MKKKKIYPTSKRQQAEEERLQEDILDNKLFDILEVLELPSKWRISLDGKEIMDVYPHPVLDKSHIVRKVVYRPYKYIPEAQLPTPLLVRFGQLKKDIHLANTGGIKHMVTRKNKRVTEEMKEEIARLSKMGYCRRDIAKQVGISTSLVGYYVNKYKEECFVHHG